MIVTFRYQLHTEVAHGGRADLPRYSVGGARGRAVQHIFQQFHACKRDTVRADDQPCPGIPALDLADGVPPQAAGREAYREPFKRGRPGFGTERHPADLDACGGEVLEVEG
jgi:hypothetical protein